MLGALTAAEILAAPPVESADPTKAPSIPEVAGADRAEGILDPDLPIIDPHHHLWDISEARYAADLASARASGSLFVTGILESIRQRKRYLLDELLRDLHSGHNVLATVYIENGSMYRADGPQNLRSVGEVEFANGIAAMAASGLYGPTQVCAAIVGGVDLTLGDAVEEILHAHIRAGGGRYRGIRSGVPYDTDPRIMGPGTTAHTLADPRFRAGFRHLHKLGLSCDVYLLEPQIPELTDLARAFPETRIILNHVGMPLGVAGYAGRQQERFAIWRRNLGELARCHNVNVKLGGLASPVQGFSSWMASPSFTSEQLAVEWRPYIESCIELFDVNRCMFEGDFPPTAGACSYATVWNVFKRICAGATAAEKAWLFAGTARSAYRLNI